MSENNEIQINFRDYWFYTIRKWRGMLLFGLIFAAVLGGFIICKHYLYDNKNNNYAEKMAQYNAELLSYQQIYNAYEAEFNKSNDELNAQLDYMGNSILLRLNPQYALETSVDIVIMLDDGQTDSNYDKVDSILKVYADGIMYKTDWEKVGKLVGLEEKYIKELVIVDIDYDSNVITVSVLYPDEEYGELILDDILAQANSRKNEYDLYGNYSIKELNKTSVYNKNEIVDETINASNSLYLELQNHYNDVETFINSMEMPVNPANDILSRAAFLKRIIIFAIIGFIIGVLIYFIAQYYRFVRKGIIYSGDEFGRITGLYILGIFPKNTNTRIFKAVDKLIDKKDGTYSEQDENTVLERININFNSLKEDAKDVIVLGNVSEEELSKIVEGISKKYKDIHFSSGSNIKENVDSLRRLTEADSVILVVKRENTMLSELLDEQNTLRTLDKHVIGCVVL